MNETQTVLILFRSYVRSFVLYVRYKEKESFRYELKADMVICERVLCVTTHTGATGATDAAAMAATNYYRRHNLG